MASLQDLRRRVRAVRKASSITPGWHISSLTPSGRCLTIARRTASVRAPV